MFNEASLPEKEDFYRHLNMVDITDADCRFQKQFVKILKLTKLGEYLHLFVQRDTLLLADIFENFRNMCLEIYELDPAKFVSAPGLEW